MGLGEMDGSMDTVLVTKAQGLEFNPRHSHVSQIHVYNCSSGEGESGRFLGLAGQSL